jgi:hypothetical protein
MAAFRLCAVSDCGKAVVARAMCGPHYRRLIKHGDPLAGPTFLGEATAFLERAKRHEGEGCLFWPFSRNRAGYGQVSCAGKPQLAHRVVCAHRHGEPAEPTLEAAHSCGNGHLGCVAPAHLRWATRQQNNEDRVSGPRNRYCGATKLDESSVAAIRADKRSRREIAAHYEISVNYVTDIRARRAWKDT